MTVQSKSFDTPDEQRTPDKTCVAVVKLPGAGVARITFEPGHDAWAVGDQPAIGLEFESSAAETCAKN